MNTSIRSQRTARTLHRALCQTLSELIKQIRPHALLSITHLTLAPDMSCAKVYVSILPEMHTDVLMQHMSLQMPHIKRRLTALIGKKVRKIPQILFVEDKTLKRAMDLHQIFNAASLE